jgi:26S proteasome regulatory subunit T6
MMVEKVPDSTYEMVGGLDKQIKEIKEVIELPVKHPELFESLGIAQPKGVLLYGPPGTGKTLLARAVAHHTDCKFIRVSGSELVQKYIGEGSRMVRELFVMAREHAPSIIFMDEIDSIGSSRGESGSGGGDSEVQRTMLELLNQLDGFEPTKNIKVIMATNRIGEDCVLLVLDHQFHTLVNQIYLTRLSSDLAASTARSNSHLLARKLVSAFYAFILER